MSQQEKQKYRLNNAEFFNYMPHLKLEEVLMIQIRRNGVWCYLFNATYKGQRQFNTLKCIPCNEYIQFDMFTKHLKSERHLQALKCVDQFYHPTYTYAKICEKVANGVNVSKEEIENAAALTMQSQAIYNDKIAFSVSKSIAQYIREQERDYENNNFERVLTKLILSEEVKGPKAFLAEVQLPMEDLLNVEFSKQEGKWIKMLTVNKINNTKFYCALCAKFLFGVLTLEGHFKGAPHKVEQLKCIELRCAGYPHLTKNCLYGYGEKYLLSINKKARETFKDKAIALIQANENEDINCNEPNVATQAYKGTEQTNIQNKSAERNTGSGGSKFGTNLPSTDAKSQLLNRDIESNEEGLIGVEYVVKIMKSEDDPYPRYECCLCEIELSENRMQNHLTGYNHRLKYCESHYPDTLKKYNNIIGHTKYSNYFNVMGHVLSKIAAGIESHHGRDVPLKVSAADFNAKRAEIMERVYGFRNACQQQGPSFTTVVSPEEIQKIIKNNIVYTPRQVNTPGKVARFTLVPEGKIYLNQRSHDPNKRNMDNAHEVRKRGRSQTSQSNKQYPEPSLSPERDVAKKAKQSDNPCESNIPLSLNEVNKKYAEYRKNPEIHPNYDKEWDSFWRRRKDELQKEGVDHRSYNFQPEWVQFFNQRLEELFEAEVQEVENKIRNSFKPAFSNETHIPGAFHISEQDNVCSDLSQLNKPPISVNDAPFLKQNHGVDIEISDKPKVIHVLRLLTALEDQLGSLGARIMDLLSKALMLEKTCYNNPEKLDESILTYDNCTLLETAGEKLKGILFAGLLDGSKVPGFKHVISSTTDLLKYAEKKGWRVPPSEYSEKPNDNYELQKLIQIMQANRRDIPSLGQRSLSDTLRDLMERKPNLNTTESVNQRYPFLNSGITSNVNNLPNTYKGSQPNTSNVNLENYQQNNRNQGLISMPTPNYVNKPLFGNNFNNGSEMGRSNLNMNAYNRSNQFENNMPRLGSQTGFSQLGNSNQTSNGQSSSSLGRKNVNSIWGNFNNKSQW